MEKFFNNILKSVPKPFLNIKNSFEFIHKIKNLKIPNNYTMISLDVISLSTNIPLDLVLISIEKRWYCISKFTKLSLEQFKLGIKILMEQTFFFSLTIVFTDKPAAPQCVLLFLRLLRILLCKT